MKLHVEYDDFGEYVEAVIDGELVPVKDCESDRRSVELIHQEFPTQSSIIFDGLFCSFAKKSKLFI